MNKIIHEAITIFGSKVVKETFDWLTIGNPYVLYDTFDKMNMPRYAECIQFIFLKETNQHK
jgi:hypothetical protein